MCEWKARESLEGRGCLQNPPYCVLFYQRLADLFQSGTRVAQNKSAPAGPPRGERDHAHFAVCRKRALSSCSQRAKHRRGIGIGRTRATAVPIQADTHLAQAPCVQKCSQGVTEVQSHKSSWWSTPHVRAPHLATLPERRGSSGEAMMTRRGQMGVRAGVGSLWDPREQQDRRDPTSCCGNARLSLRSALLLLLLPFLLLLISATSSSSSLPAISKAPFQCKRLSRTLERIPWVAFGQQRTPRGHRSTCPAGT